MDTWGKRRFDVAFPTNVDTLNVNHLGVGELHGTGTSLQIGNSSIPTDVEGSVLNLGSDSFPTNILGSLTTIGDSSHPIVLNGNVVNLGLTAVNILIGGTIGGIGATMYLVSPGGIFIDANNVNFGTRSSAGFLDVITIGSSTAPSVTVDALTVGIGRDATAINIGGTAGGLGDLFSMQSAGVISMQAPQLLGNTFPLQRTIMASNNFLTYAYPGTLATNAQLNLMNPASYFGSSSIIANTGVSGGGYKFTFAGFTNFTVAPTTATVTLFSGPTSTNAVFQIPPFALLAGVHSFSVVIETTQANLFAGNQLNVWGSFLRSSGTGVAFANYNASNISAPYDPTVLNVFEVSILLQPYTQTGGDYITVYLAKIEVT
jgi:hypothetical protein